ncbi:family 43 glycosylhydrolase [Halolactibacillus miurensis]|nr:family 43 glycosylhydrolase [Halolactibacillus miurensis]
MKKQAFNPYLPSDEYIPDGEPYVFGDRVYVYGSHDQFNGKAFCENDYVTWSAPIDDLASWRYEGIIYKKNQDPHNKTGKKNMFAPDIAKGPDGQYYLYYTLGFSGVMSVAKSETPTGPFEFYGHVKYPDGNIVGKQTGDVFQFDPGIFVDDERVYLYSGFAPKKTSPLRLLSKGRRMVGAYVFELEKDMLTVKSGPALIVPQVSDAKDTSFNNHAFFEASSMRKMGERYYFIYSSIHEHELCYAISDYPDRDFVFGGTIISNGNIDVDQQDRQAEYYYGNNHGSLVEINNQWYVFYHRHTNGHMFSRQACAEKITINSNGSIDQVEMTSCGLNNGPLLGQGEYEARIASVLMSDKGANRYRPWAILNKYRQPYITETKQDGEDRPIQYIANMHDGSVVGFKYFNMMNLNKLAIKVKSKMNGKILVSTELNGKQMTAIDVKSCEEFSWFSSRELENVEGIVALYFMFIGEGVLDFLSFELS